MHTQSIKRGLPALALAVTGIALPGPAFADETRHCLLQAEVNVSKQAEPHPPMQPGLVISYVLTAVNNGASSSDLSIVDDMTDTVDDAHVTGEPVPSAGTVTRDGNLYKWDLALDSGGVATMRYAVTIKAWEQLGDGRVRNAITAQMQGQQARSCQIEEVLPPHGGAETGDGSTIGAGHATAAVATSAAAVGIGGFLVMRRRHSASR